MDSKILEYLNKELKELNNKYDRYLKDYDNLELSKERSYIETIIKEIQIKKRFIRKYY